MGDNPSFHPEWASLGFAADTRWQGVYHSVPQSIPGIEGERPLSLWLPQGFGHPERIWPLAVFFDGQNLFGDEGTLAGGWHLHAQLAEREAAGKPVPVVLGLHHGPQRESELSPWNPFPGVEGKATAQLDWLKNQLLPQMLLDQRLDKDPDSALIAGSSLGGLAALYTLFHYPACFGKALVMSPALWPDRFAIFQDIMLAAPRADARIYLDHGQREILDAGKEHFGKILFEQTQLMADLLDVLGFKPGERLCWNPDPEGEHNERCWSRRLPVALDFLYGSTM